MFHNVDSPSCYRTQFNSWWDMSWDSKQVITTWRHKVPRKKVQDFWWGAKSSSSTAEVAAWMNVDMVDPRTHVCLPRSGQVRWDDAPRGFCNLDGGFCHPLGRARLQQRRWRWWFMMLEVCLQVTRMSVVLWHWLSHTHFIAVTYVQCLVQASQVLMGWPLLSFHSTRVMENILLSVDRWV